MVGALQHAHRWMEPSAACINMQGRQIWHRERVGTVREGRREEEDGVVKEEAKEGGARKGEKNEERVCGCVVEAAP